MTLPPDRIRHRRPAANKLAALSAFAALSVTSAACAPEPEDAQDGPEHLVLVVIDTLRADHVGANGYPLGTTPTLDALAARGAVFRQAIAQSSWTRPSMATLMTGLYPTTTGLVCHNFRHPKGDCDVLHPGLVTLAELFAGAGYETAGVVANINVDPVFGFDQGFEHYVCVPERLAAQDPDWRTHNDWLSATTRAVTEEALTWLDGWEQRGRRGPFLLYLHYLDPHEPYEPPPEHSSFAASDYPDVAADHRDAVARYDGELRYVDTELARVLARLRDSGLEGSTAILVTSDHGEEFGDHGGAYHGWTLFDEQTHVPLAVVAPGLVPAGTLIDDQVRLLDIAPTALEMFGLEIPEWMEGASLIDLARGTSSGNRSAFSERAYAPLSALRDPPWKLVHDHASGESWLYDVLADPGEQRDIASAQPDVAAELLQRLLTTRAAAERAAGRFPSSGVDLDLSAEKIEQLRALGYEDS